MQFATLNPLENYLFNLIFCSSGKTRKWVGDGQKKSGNSWRETRDFRSLQNFQGDAENQGYIEQKENQESPKIEYNRKRGVAKSDGAKTCRSTSKWINSIADFRK